MANRSEKTIPDPLWKSARRKISTGGRESFFDEVANIEQIRASSPAGVLRPQGVGKGF